MKNILLISPLWEKNSKSIFKYMYGVFPPLGLALLASVLEKEGHRVKIIDCSALEIHSQNILRYIKEEYDFIGISVLSHSAYSGYRIAEEIKKNMRDAVVILGGVHATAMPEEVITNPYIDICVRGEGEEAIKEIVAGCPLSRIKGISYKNNGSFVHNGDRDIILNLDSYPLPAYHLLPMNRYRSVLGIAIREPSIGLMASRGCPGNCEYCFPNSLGRKVRIRSPRRVFKDTPSFKN